MNDKKLHFDVYSLARVISSKIENFKEKSFFLPPQFCFSI